MDGEGLWVRWRAKVANSTSIFLIMDLVELNLLHCHNKMFHRVH